MRTLHISLLAIFAAPFLMAPSCIPIPPPPPPPDDDAGPTCGDGVLDPGEICDGNCPTSCNDGNACTTDTLTGTECNRRCTHGNVTACANADGCCPSGCNLNNDSDCMGACGNGVVEMGETCDGNCPTSCNDGNACTTDTLMGTACTRSCQTAPITMCVSGDGCCAPGCTSANDNNCVAACGNGVVEMGETCDGNCPTSCNDGNACTTDALTGTACTRRCTATAITMCVSGDGCCAPGCNGNNDNNCVAACGNGVVEAGETCDGNCPTSCNDGNACTTDTLMGTACARLCSSSAITMCVGSDGCCAPGCTANNDNNCVAACGNGVVEAGETCDGNCPTSCNDGNACTTDTLTGTACTRSCQSAPVSACASGDGCCPSGCTNANDNDCAPPAPTDCTAEYNITPSFRLAGTPLGFFDGTYALPAGKVILKLEADASGAPRAGGRAELLFMYVPTRFSVTASGLTLAFNVNGFDAQCSGTVNPPPAGQTAPPFATPPTTCNFTAGTTTMATGTFNGTTITWDACTRAAAYGGNDYTPASTSVSTGPGCAKGYRAVGVITCTDNSVLGTCAAASLVDGQNLENSTFNQPLETITFTNGIQNASIAVGAVPNSLPGASSLSWTGVRSGGTCR